MRRIALACLVTLAVTTAGTLLTEVASAAYYSPCSSVRYKGRAYKVFRHAMTCRPARIYAKRVLITRRSVRGWRCTLRTLGRGVVICRRRSKAFTFGPRRTRAAVVPRR
jgi:hypothetical protein